MNVLSQPLCNRLQRDWKLPITPSKSGPSKSEEIWISKFFGFSSLLSLNWKHDWGSLYSYKDIVRC